MAVSKQVEPVLPTVRISASSRSAGDMINIMRLRRPGVDGKPPPSYFEDLSRRVRLVISIHLLSDDQ